MPSKAAIAFYYTRQNRNSYNVLAGALERNQIDVPVYFLERDFEKNLSRVAKKFEKTIVAVSFSTPQFFQIANMIKILKKHNNEKIFFVAGGPHPSGDPEGALKLGFDAVVVGEGEETFSELVSKINNDEDCHKIKGIAYLSDGKYEFNEYRKPIVLDDYPPFAPKHKKFNHIEITRGCSFGCKFCQTSFLYHTPARHRSIENICKYAKIMIDNDLKDIRFITPNAFGYGSSDGRKVNLEAVEDLLKSVKEINKKGRIFFGSFPSEVRPEHVSAETISLIKKYCDNDNLIIGAQSGSSKILKECNRGHTVDDVYNAVELTIKSGLKANADFIFGLPRETEDDMNMTLRVMEDLIRMGARIHGHVFMPLAGTPYANEPAGKLSEKFLEKLNRLASTGKLYGEWKEQEKIATRISHSKFLR